MLGKKCEHISVLIYFTLNSAVPTEKAGVGFPLFAWRSTSWRKGHLCTLL